MPGRNSLKPARSRRWLRWVLLGLLVLLLLPVAEVVAVRFINPPITPEMVRFKLFSGNKAARERGLRYEWMPLRDIPLAQVHFLWASEDQRFFEHHGFDLDEIHQAIRESEKSGHRPRGGSTISQQCARSLFLWQGRSWVRKGLEAYYTFLMEHILSKRRILELYVNVIEFGDGIYGIKAAAETYYGKPPARLTDTQMALLVAVLPNPKNWNPIHPSERVIERLRRVLRLERAAAFPASKLR